MPMIAGTRGFTDLERAVLDFICKTSLEEGIALAAQLATAKIRSRENTGAGFYTDFDVDRQAFAGIVGAKPQDLRYGPTAKVEGIAYGMGFILWLSDGYAKCLEGYSFQESTTAIDFERVVFELSPLEINRTDKH
jgi:hypothetical protein